MTNAPTASARPPRILVIDDEAPIRALCRRILMRDGYQVEEAADGAAALELLDLTDVDVVVTDLRMPEVRGLDVLRAVKARKPRVEVIIITAHGTIQDAIEAMRDGALDFLVKPFDVQQFSLVVARALERRSMVREIHTLRQELRTRYHLGRLRGKSPAMQRLYDLVDQFAPIDVSVLISGESGTGKEVLARTIHQMSRRADGPFIAVNCGAIVREIFESELFGHTRGSFTGATADKTGYFRDADGGTIFLDEVTEMPTSAQVKLLRVLQEREVVPVGTSRPVPIDVRVIAASNQDLAAALDGGALRQDLYFRLNVVHLQLPPLRERSEDVALLAMGFVEQAAARLHRPQVVGVAPSTLDILNAHTWPGNVRELQNTIEYAVVLSSGTEVLPESLPSSVLARQVARSARSPTLATTAASPDAVDEDAPFPSLEEIERAHIDRALRHAGGHRKRAADLLGIDPKTLYRKLLREQADLDLTPEVEPATVPRPESSAD